MHNCVLSNTGPSSALTETGICTSLKSDFYLWFHHWIQRRHCQILSVHGIWCCSVEKCAHQSLKTAEIGICTPLKAANCFRFVSNRRRSDHIPELLAKFGENRYRIVDVIPNRNQIRNSHISKILFLFPVSVTTEYKVRIAEFYMYMRLGADLLTNVVTRAWILNLNPHISKIGKPLPVCLTNNSRRSDHISEPHAKFGENR